jgi:hypothetical protein
MVFRNLDFSKMKCKKKSKREFQPARMTQPEFSWVQFSN